MMSLMFVFFALGTIYIWSLSKDIEAMHKDIAERLDRIEKGLK